MPGIYFLIRGQKNPSPIYLRFFNGRKLNIFVKIGLLINPKHWDNKKQRLRNLAEATQKDFINATLEKLSAYILERINKDYVKGISINKEWARKAIKEFFNQPEENILFFTDYVSGYIEKAPDLIIPGKEKGISSGRITKYKTTLYKLKNFEEYKKNRLRFTDIGLNFHNDFITYLRDKEHIGLKTIGSYINTIKFFARKAKSSGYLINEEVNHSDFFVPDSETKSIYLNDEEINKIFAFDLSDNDRLENARDNAIVGLRTGLRVSDFLQLDTDHIKGDFIEVKTKKTGHNVIIPLHPQVKVILEKRKGLPQKISDQKFNIYFKEVCQMVGITEEVKGARMNPDTKRKEEGIFPKYQLVSSHTCRRSFATNLYGKLRNLSIMAITGHKTEKQFLEYIKITPREHAEKLKEFWENSVLPN